MDHLSDADIERRASSIASEWDGIYPAYEAFYIQSILYAAGRADAAFECFELARIQGESDAAQVSAIHEALGHAAGLSRFFWPSALGGRRAAALLGLRQARAAVLRAAFALDDDSPLRDRNLRDSLEHFDEKLDSYLLANTTGYFFPDPMVDYADIVDENVGHIFKLVDPQRSIFVILGQKFDCGTVSREVSKVLKFVEAMARSGARITRKDAPGT
jgi:hypothetical protein